MDDQGCPRCKTTKYRNPSLKLLVNVCGHTLCENCVDLLFIKGSGVCGECGTTLRRNNFRLQLFEDAYIEKEVDIRKKILKDFNKKEEDFTTLREYNDYLENLETIIFNLTNNIDVETTKKMVDQHKKENKEEIQKNKNKMSKDEEYLEMLIAEEQEGTKIRKQIDFEEEKIEKNKKKKNKEALLDELMFSDLPASAIMASHNTDIEPMEVNATKPQHTTFSTGLKWGFSGTREPIPKSVEGEAYIYSSVELHILGPKPPDETGVQDKGYINNVRSATDQEKAGGYDSRFACQRALMEAMSGLFLYPDT